MKTIKSTEERLASDDLRSNEIRELVNRASQVIAHYWPMTTFVHHNPIRSLESYQFNDAVKIAERLIGGHGYLANEQFRRLVKSGRIQYEHLDEALRSKAHNELVEIGGQEVHQFDVLRAHMLVGISPPADELVPALIDRTTSRSIDELVQLAKAPLEKSDTVVANRGSISFEIRELAKRLTPNIEIEDMASKLGRDLSLVTWCDRAFNNQLEWQINRELIKWCEAFLDEGHAAWPMPERERGFYLAWKSLAALEWSPCGITASAKKINLLPQDPEEAILAHLDALAIPEDLRQDYLSLQLTSLCGWASFINWRAEHGSYEWQVAYPIDLVQYLAVRLFYERELVDQTCREELGIEGNLDKIVLYLRGSEKTGNHSSIENWCLASAWRLTILKSALGISTSALGAADSKQLNQILEWLDQFPEKDHGPVWLQAYETGYHRDLIQKIQVQVSKPDEDDKESVRPLAQAMFCIDVRSEPFRRNLEAVGAYDTIGFAGFFGIPMRSRALDQHHETDQLPAIVQPKFTVHEVIREDQKKPFEKHNRGVGIFHTIQEMLHDMKSHVLTPYVMVESLGWLFGVQLFGRTLLPQFYRWMQTKVKNTVAPPVGTKMTTDRNDDGLGLTAEEQCTTIEAVLRTMGLVKNFARLVLVCGHTSTSDNNPYEAALNCGACGGNSGKPNARLLAAMANMPHVREHLAKNGIVIPQDTHFMGGVHDTTTDIVQLFDLEDLPDTHRQDLERLKTDLGEAARRTNRERCIRLPGVGRDPSPSLVAREISRRAGDWSETRPEWGLASNAAFIIGDRTLTKDINLEGRVFLNSHDYRIDPTGALLEGVMMGPMVVGQWINAEHYFSATDTEVYGSGSKIYHNVVGRIGIMSGPQSDLRTGLAWQSMMAGELPYHEPLRLFVVIEAPRQRILDIIERQPVLKQLCDNEWIHLMAVDRESDSVLYRYQPKQGWVSISA